MKDTFSYLLPIPEAQPMDIAVRGYVCRDQSSAQKDEVKTDTKKHAKKKTSIPSTWALVFDTETTIDAAQALRFGTYQVRKNENLVQLGIFYDPDKLNKEEIELLKEYVWQISEQNGVILTTCSDCKHEAYIRQ